MHARRPSWALCRAVIAVAALYALALQSLLGALHGPASFDPAHILCLTETGSGEGPAKSVPGQAHLPCCTAAHQAPGLLAPPVPAPVFVAWPVRPSVAVAWRPEIIAAPRAPPGISASARAPPVV